MGLTTADLWSDLQNTKMCCSQVDGVGIMVLGGFADCSLVNGDLTELKYQEI